MKTQKKTSGFRLSTRKTFRYTLYTLGVLFTLAFLLSVMATYIYRQELSSQIEQKVNEALNVSFSYQKAHLNYITKAGELTLSLKNVEVQGQSKAEIPHNLLEIEWVHFSLSWSDFFRGQYRVDKIYIEGSRLKASINEKGQANFDSLWQVPNSKAQSLDWPIRKLIVKDLQVEYSNLESLEESRLLIPNLVGSFSSSNAAGPSQWEGLLENIRLQQAGLQYWEEKRIPIRAEIKYSAADNTYHLDKGQLQVKGVNFLAEGKYQIRGDQLHRLDINFRGANPSLETLFALLPMDYYAISQGFSPFGRVDLNGKIEGLWTRQKAPNFEVDFSAQDLTLNSKHNVRRNIEKLNFKGQFSNGDKNNLRSASLRIENLEGRLANRPFKGEFYMLDLTEPYLSLSVEAGIDLAYWQEFYPFQNIREMKGLLGLNFNLEVDWRELNADKEASEKNLNLNGSLELAGVNFKSRLNALEYKDINLRLDLLNNQADIQECFAKIGKSDLKMEGYLLNLPAYLFAEDQALILHGNLSSKRLDLDEILSEAFQDRSNPSPVEAPKPYLFIAPEQIEAYLNIESDSLYFRRFKGQEMRGSIALKEKVFRTGNLNVKTLGGQVNLLGIFNAQKEDYLRFDGRVILNNVASRGVFDTFENFSQDFLKKENIRGSLDADLKTSFVLDKNLNFDYPHLVADIEAKLRQGSIRDFILLKDIARKISAPDLANLDFEELKSIIQIRNQTIFIPEIEISAEQTLISLIGRATEDKGLDYKIKIPRKDLNINPRASYVKEVDGQISYFLSVKGPPQSMRISFTDIPDKSQLNDYWEQEKKAYLNLFKRTSLSEEPFPVDTIRIAYFK